MTIRIDGDGCPDIKHMENLAMEYQIPMVVYVDTDHAMHLYYAKVDITDTGSQNVDIKLSNQVTSNDIVVTQDYGVAVISLSKGAYAVHPNGTLYSDENMLMLLEGRHQNQKLRKQKCHVKGPKKRSHEDTKRLIKTLKNIILREME